MRRLSRAECARAPRVSWRLALALAVFVELTAGQTASLEATPAPEAEKELQADNSDLSTNYCCRHAPRALFSMRWFLSHVVWVEVHCSLVSSRGCNLRSTLEATQGQFDDFFRQLPCKCHLEEMASVGN